MDENSFSFLGETGLFSDKENRIMYVDEVATSPDYRNRGIATLLETVLLSEARKAGFSWAVLRTDERNKAAVNVYEKLGFKQINGREGSIKDPEFSNRIYMARQLWK